MNIDYSYVAMVFLFLSQLTTISVYVSYRWCSSRKKLLTQYSQASFPNLYVQPEHTEFQRLKYRRRFDSVVLAIGLCALVFALVSNLSLFELSKIMIVVAALQLLPIFLSGYWCAQNSNIMQKRFPSRIRAAALSSRENYSKQIVYPLLAVSMYLLSTAVGWWLSNTVSDSYSLDKIVKIQWLSLFVFLSMLFMYLTTMFGRKRDNFAEPEEYLLRVSNKKRYLTVMLCVFNVFILYILCSVAFSFGNIYVTAITSILVQAIVITTKNQYFPINPLVYK